MQMPLPSASAPGFFSPTKNEQVLPQKQNPNIRSSYPRHVPLSHGRVLVQPVRGGQPGDEGVERVAVHRVEPVQELPPAPG